MVSLPACTGAERRQRDNGLSEGTGQIKRPAASDQTHGASGGMEFRVGGVNSSIAAALESE